MDEKLSNVFEGSLYDPENLQKVREQFANEKVVVLDLDGVIRGYENREIVSEQAIAAVDKLLQEGSKLVLWTSAVIEKMNTSFLRRHNIAERFSLIIHGNNFDRSVENEDLFNSALSDMPWLSVEEKTILQEYYLSGDGCKPIPVAFASCSVVEDSWSVLPEHFKRTSEDYKFVYSPTFNGNGGTDDVESKRFGMKDIETILSVPVNNLERKSNSKV